MSRAPRMVAGIFAFLLVAGALQASTASAKQVYPLLDQFGGEGTPAGSFGEGQQQLHEAIDGKTDRVLIADNEHHVLDVFSASGSFACQISGAGSSAADPAHECDSADPGVPGGGFDSRTGLEGVATNDVTGDIYLALRRSGSETTEAAVDVFSASGRYLCQITGLGEASTSPSECDTTAPGTPDGSFRNPVGTEPGNNGSLHGVAVDPSTGDLFVAAYATRINDYVHIDVFGPGGRYLWQLTAADAPEGGEISADLAVDATTNRLLVKDGRNGGIDVFDLATHAYLETWTGADTPTGNLGLNASNAPLAVDQASGNVYLPVYISSSELVLYAFGASGEYRYQINGTPAPFEGVGGLAVEPATGNLYFLDAGKRLVDVFSGTPVTVPDVELALRSSAEVTSSTASLHGAVDPDGLPVTECRFEYVEAAAYQPSAANPYAAGGSAPCEPEPGSGEGQVAVSADISGLEMSTIYHFRLLAGNANGPDVTRDERFVTDGLGFGIASFEAPIANAGGEAETRAGAHPFSQTTSFSVNTTISAIGREIPDGGQIKDIEVRLPAGLTGNPRAVPPCSETQFLSESGCPPESQVGSIQLKTWAGQGLPDADKPQAVYSLIPPRGLPALLGFKILNAPVRIEISLRSGSDYGLTANLRDVPETIPFKTQSLAIWGVPADPAHNPLRHCAGSTALGCESQAAPKPYLTLPTACTGPLQTTLSVDSWFKPGTFSSVGYTSQDLEGNPVGIEGCNGLRFEPTITARPTTIHADSASGLDFDLHLPQNEAPEGRATADLKSATVTLPEGLSVNPALANGLGACSEAQIGYKQGSSNPFEFTPEPAGCPSAAKLGKVEVITPAFDHPLPGAVYLATPHENPFGALQALYIAVHDPQTGVVVKLAGHVEAGGEAGGGNGLAPGQLRATFPESPQQPFEDFKLHFFSGTLRTPPNCATFRTTSDLVPWTAPQGQDARPADSFQVTASADGSSPCPAGPAEAPNAPAFHAGTEAPQAGQFSPFALRLARADGSQELSKIETTLPQGLLGRLAGVTECPEAQIAVAESRERERDGAEEQQSPSCPASSEVGKVEVAAGAGPTPLYVSGRAYLAGPYHGAPLSLAIVTPAVAGPFDLGDVVVRTALFVDPFTARIRAVSDPIPHILQGIPLDLRSITLKMDRPHFTLNPTDCEELHFEGSATSVLGTVAPLAQRFQVGGCAALAFKPKFSLRLQGSPKRSRFPALTATLKMPPGGANVAAAQVTLPHSSFLANAHIDKTCGRPELAAHTCPAASVYGHATAVTPLLDHPLEGPVYLATGFGYKLPALVADLDGQIEVQLVGKVDTGKEDGIRNTFEVVPDAPVSKFTLKMFGGRKGLIENSEDLCAPHAKRKALARFIAQNGRIVELEPTVGNGCKRNKHHRKAHRGRGRASVAVRVR